MLDIQRSGDNKLDPAERKVLAPRPNRPESSRGFHSRAGNRRFYRNTDDIMRSTTLIDAQEYRGSCKEISREVIREGLRKRVCRVHDLGCNTYPTSEKNILDAAYMYRVFKVTISAIFSPVGIFASHNDCKSSF